MVFEYYLLGREKCQQELMHVHGLNVPFALRLVVVAYSNEANLICLVLCMLVRNGHLGR